MVITFFPGRLQGIQAAPPSKSEAHRRMICAGLTDGRTCFSRFQASGDTEATLHCLQALGAHVSVEGEEICVQGCVPVRSSMLPVYRCGESASTLRFFVPLALALTDGGVFRMRGRLSQRPMDVYRELFVPRGVQWRMGVGADGAAELTVRGGMSHGDFVLPGNVSSQFISGLLFAMPLLEGTSNLTVVPPVESIGYIRMTLQALTDSGITVNARGEYAWEIPGRQRYHAISGALHGDWTQAAALLCMGALGGDVQVTGLNPASIQGDRAVVDILTRLGAHVTPTPDGVRVAGSTLQPVELDLRHTPDIAPMVALLCQMAPGHSILHGCGRLRLKEVDRLSSTVQILNMLGGQARVEGDTLHIDGVERLQGGVTLPEAADHRMVMLASAAALVCEQPVTVPGVESLGKSWPSYLDVYRALGGQAQ